jgi:hypothetical protein
MVSKKLTKFPHPSDYIKIISSIISQVMPLPFLEVIFFTVWSFIFPETARMKLQLGGKKNRDASKNVYIAVCLLRNQHDNISYNNWHSS